MNYGILKLFIISIVILNTTLSWAIQREKIYCTDIISDSGKNTVLHVNNLDLDPLFYGHYELVERTSSGIRQQLSANLDYCEFQKESIHAKCYSHAESDTHLAVDVSEVSKDSEKYYIIRIGQGLDQPREILARQCSLSFIEQEH